MSNARTTLPGAAMQASVARLSKRTGAVSDLEVAARIVTTVSKDAKVDISIGRKWDRPDDRSRYGGQQQQSECDEEQDGQWRGRSQHRDVLVTRFSNGSVAVRLGCEVRERQQR